jgi:hypothetical protein
MNGSPRIARSTALRAALIAALAVAPCACHSPSYTLPNDSVSPTVRLVQADPTADAPVDIGSSAEDLCVVQSVSGWVAQASAGASDGGSVASALSQVSQVNLFFDPAGEWYVTAAGSVNATIACAPWAAFGGSHSLWRVDTGASGAEPYYANGSNSAPLGTASITTSTDGGFDCFLTDLEGDFVSSGNGASVDAVGDLVVTNTSGNGIFASETCFGGSPRVPFEDFPVDSADASINVPLTLDGGALCGLSALSSLGQPQSGVVVGNGNALGTDSTSTVRCFLFVGPDGGAL